MSEFDIFGDVAPTAPPPTQTPEALQAIASLAARVQPSPSSAETSNTPSPTPSPTPTPTPTPSTTVDIPSYGPLWTPATSPYIHYLHPSLLVASTPSMGGSRDVSTSTPLPPGTLILKEQTIIKYPSTLSTTPDGNKQLDFEVVKHIYARPDSDAVLSALAPLHPVTLTDLPARSRATKIKDLKSNFQPSIDHITSTYNVQEKTVLRLWFVVSLNGYASGLSLYSSMFNHATIPSAVRYFDSSTSTSSVFLTKNIAPHTPIRISYLDPREQTFNDRQKYFSSQHFFELGDSHPSDNAASTADVPAIQNSCVELEKSLVEIEGVFELSKNTESKDNIKELIESIADHEIATRLLRDTAKTTLDNKNHFMAIRTLKLHSDSTALFFSITDFEDRKLNKVDTAYRIEALTEFLRSSYTLLNILKTNHHLGEFHPEVGRVWSDVAQAVGGLLGEGKVGLEGIVGVVGDEKGRNFEAAAKFEQSCLKKFEEIQTSYKVEGE